MLKGSAGVLAAGDQFHVPAANTIATQTLAAPTNGSWVIGGVIFGYDATPSTAGLFSIESPAATSIIEIPIDLGGPTDIDFHPPLRFPLATAVKINLTAGGAGIIGGVAFKACWVE